MTEESLSDLMIEVSQNKSFSILEDHVSKETLEAINVKGFTEMTEIQAQSIPHLLSGRDLLGAAKTGSGKTLAFLIPVVELIKKLKFKRSHGTGAVILSPTRELAEQTYKVLEELSVQHKHTFGLIMGGVNKMNEVKMLTEGVNILIATPGRLLDHLNNTRRFVYKNLRCLVFDEADKILQNGFEKDINKILEIFPKNRQTVLFSATQTQKTEDLARVSLKNPVYVGVDDNREHSTVEGLQQGYLLCPAEKKFLVLLATLIREQEKKVMVFFSTCLEVEFFSNLFEFIRFPVIAVHGQQNQSRRTETTSEFRRAKKSILLCTDVFGRGIDFKAVDLIIQYDLPPNSEEYIHRVGRTARGQGGTGRALLFVLPEERIFLMYLRKNKIPVKEFTIKWNKIPDAQAALEKAVQEVYNLHQLSKKAYKAYIRSYKANSGNKGLDVHQLDLKGVATSFGLKEIPHIDLDIGGRKAKRPQTSDLSKVPKKKSKVSND